MSSSPEAIAAYVAHLKKNTAAAHARSPDEAIIDDYLENDEKESYISRSGARSSLTKNSFESHAQTSTIPDKLRKFENKYVRRDKKKVIHKSSVDRVSEESNEGHGSTTQDESLMDSQLEKWLEESSSSSNDHRTSRVRKSGLKNIQSCESLFRMSATHSSPTKAQDFKEKSVSASNKRQMFKASRGGSNGQVSSGMITRSFSLERAELRHRPPEGDGTISTTPERSIGSLLKKNSNSSIFRSSSLRDDLSTPEEHLSRKISRRDSYIYRDGVGLVSASASSDETIHTDYEISDDNEENFSKVLTQSRSLTGSKSGEKIDSSVTRASKKEGDKCAGQKQLIQASSKRDFNRSETENTSEIKNHSQSDHNGSVLNSNDYSSSFESDTSGETSELSVNHRRKSNSVSDDNRSRKNQSRKFRSYEAESTKRRREQHMTSSTSISLDTTSRSRLSCHCSHVCPKNRSKHRHRSHSCENRCSECDRSMRHRRTKSRYCRRKSCTCDWTSSSSSEREVTCRRRARSCRSHSKKKRKECSNCKLLQDLLLGSSVERLRGPTFQFQLPVGLGTFGTRGSLAKVERIEDAMRETIALGQKFLATQRSMYGAYCTTLQSTHRYTTVHQIKEQLSAAASEG